MAPALLLLLAAATAANDPSAGREIYQRQCALCHGASGEGVLDQYAQPLIGERSLADLTKLIVETMPEDDPGACVGEAAEQVAAYVYNEFYSSAAQARRGRPHPDLARLTVRQYRETVADLIGGFGDAASFNGLRLDAERGLRGEYFNAKHFSGDKRVLERRDATVDFKFAEASPLADKIEPQEFSIRWQGSLLAPDTGDYEFTLRSENGARLWLNDNRRALIDAWVKSGEETEHRETIRLLGGRVYPLRLEFFKSKEAKEKTASIALVWKPPGGVAEVVPERCLSPQGTQETFVVHTPFPPDDRSTGYERGTSVSKAWEQATTYAAIEAAGHVVANLKQLSGCPDDAADRPARLREFCQRFVERAFGRPLTDEQKALFIERQFAGAADLETAVKRTVLLALTSPRFLYRDLGGRGGRPMDAYDVASRISFGLWDSLPDRQLWEAAGQGQLSTKEQVATQVERMLGDVRARSKLREFFHQWLRVDLADELRKDRTLFPEFDERAVADLRVSLDLFLDDVAWSEASDFRQLLLADFLYLNGRLAPFYGASLPPDAPFQKVPLDAAQRSGVVSHPYLLARFAYLGASSPIHRGVFLMRGVLGRQLRPPPEAVAPLSPDLHPDMTTRERTTVQTSPAACQSCHEVINPLGFALEGYDAIGRFRAEEKGRPIDDAGYYQSLAGPRAEFHGARQLGTFLADSDEARRAFVQQLFRYFVKQPERALGTDLPERLRRNFAEHNFHIRRLLVEIITASAVSG